MVTPVIIQILFWIGAFLCLIIGAVMVIYGATHFQGARDTTCGRACSSSCWASGSRVYCEILIIFSSALTRP